MARLQRAEDAPAVFLVNVRSRLGRDGAEQARAALQAAGLRVDARLVSTEEEAARILRAEIDGHAPFVVVGGGDGTLSTAAGALVGSDTALAALPMGTGNTLARSLGLPLNIADAAAALAAGRAMSVDVGEVSGRVFVNSVTLGLSGHIAEALDAGMKRRLGLLAWAVAGARAILGRRPLRLRITAPDRSFTLRTRQLVIANGKYLAGPVAASPRSSLTNGLLDVFALGGPGLGHLLIGALRWLVPGRRHAPEDHYFQTDRLHVESLRHPAQADVDGEIRGGTPLEIVVRAAALRVIVPVGGPE